MKIATWNVERLKHYHQLDQIQEICDKANADILVLTETDRRLHPHDPYCFQTPAPSDTSAVSYRNTESRVAIFTRYRCIRQYSTFDPHTSICVELETPKGNLLVYGTIIGIYGNRHPSFQQDLLEQLKDFSRLSKCGDGFCVCGDFNCSFLDNYYFTEKGRARLLRAFEENKLSILTAGQAECVDHIAVSNRILGGLPVMIEEWNLDKQLSDHKGIAVTF